jgi:hypothetical protein
MLFAVSAPASLHLHCLYDPSFRPARGKIERQIKAGVDCFMARYGPAAESSAEGQALDRLPPQRGQRSGNPATLFAGSDSKVFPEDI